MVFNDYAVRMLRCEVNNSGLDSSVAVIVSRYKSKENEWLLHANVTTDIEGSKKLRKGTIAEVLPEIYYMVELTCASNIANVHLCLESELMKSDREFDSSAFNKIKLLYSNFAAY